MKPATKQQLLPLGLLVGAIVCGAIAWFVDGVAFWVLAGLALVLIIAGFVAATRVDAARRDRNDQGPF